MTFDTNRYSVPPAYAGSPPVISHGIDDFLPITAKQNACLDCHADLGDAAGQEHAHRGVVARAVREGVDQAGGGAIDALPYARAASLENR